MSQELNNRSPRRAWIGRVVTAAAYAQFGFMVGGLMGHMVLDAYSQRPTLAISEEMRDTFSLPVAIGAGLVGWLWPLF